MYEKYLIQCENGNFIKLYEVGDRLLEVQEWEDISEADIFTKEVAEEHFNHIKNGNGFWTYEVDEDTNVKSMKVKKVTLTIE